MSAAEPPTKVACFFGTRPEAIKMAPVVRALQQHPGLQPLIINTGQHKELLDPVLERFNIRPDHDLAVMSPNQSLAGMTARLLEGIDAVLAAETPAFSLVQGDTTTAMSASLGSFYRRVPVGHVEAGLRTGDLAAPFPEEANRLITGRITTLHFPPTDRSRDNLLAEHVPDHRITVTGNTVIDALQIEVDRQAHEADDWVARLLGAADAQRPYVLITGHRRENFGDGFEQICHAIARLARRFPDHLFVYPVHLNPHVQKPVFDTLGQQENVRLLDPQPYSAFVALMHRCRLVLTDSGGVQEEAPGLGKPVLVMRQQTERPEGVDAGIVKLVGTDAEKIEAGVAALLEDAAAYQATARITNPYGDGHAATRIADRVARFLHESR